VRVKILFEGQFIVSSILKNGKCPIEDSQLGCDSTFSRYYIGLMDVLERVAENGLNQLPASSSHLINKHPKIYEFIRGKLRLIYFHGRGNTVVVCSDIIVKKTQKADPAVVSKAIKAHNNYYTALKEGALIVMEDTDES
jgi:hypothetical protein